MRKKKPKSRRAVLGSVRRPEFFVVLVSICFYSSMAFAQEPAEQPGVEEECFKPSPLLDVNDFPGPIKKVAGFASRTLERRTVHPPHHLPGATLCAMDPSERFALLWSDWSD